MSEFEDNLKPMQRMGVFVLSLLTFLFVLAIILGIIGGLISLFN